MCDISTRVRGLRGDAKKRVKGVGLGEQRASALLQSAPRKPQLVFVVTNLTIADIHIIHIIIMIMYK